MSKTLERMNRLIGILDYKTADNRTNGVVAYGKFSSQSDGRKVYAVAKYIGRKYGCTCPDYLYRKAVNGGKCKHIVGMMQYEKELRKAA